MSTFTVFMCSLGGGSKECEVSAGTPIETLRQEHFERENIPEFHEVRLYHSNTELSHDTVGDAGLSHGNELSVVVSRPEQHKLMEIIDRHIDDAHRNEEGTRCCIAALRLLGQYEPIERATVDALLDILLDCMFNEGHLIACSMKVTVAVGEAFGRVCNPASEYIPQLMRIRYCPAAIIALDEIDVRGQFPQEMKADYIRALMPCMSSDMSECPCHLL